MGSGLDQNCTCTTRPWSQQHYNINRSLQYLVTEEIEEQHIVYGQTDSRTTDERVSHKLNWSLTSRAKNQGVFVKHYAPGGNSLKKLFLAWRSKSRSQGHWPWCHLKGYQYLRRHAKYEASFSYGSKDIANVKIDTRQPNRQDKNNMPRSFDPGA